MTFMSRTFDNMVVQMAMTSDFTGQSQAKVRRARAAMRARTKSLRAASRGFPAS
jgi:hypothetical protein